MIKCVLYLSVQVGQAIGSSKCLPTSFTEWVKTKDVKGQGLRDRFVESLKAPVSLFKM